MSAESLVIKSGWKLLCCISLLFGSQCAIHVFSRSDSLHCSSHLHASQRGNPPEHERADLGTLRLLFHPGLGLCPSVTAQRGHIHPSAEERITIILLVILFRYMVCVLGIYYDGHISNCTKHKPLKYQSNQIEMLFLWIYFCILVNLKLDILLYLLTLCLHQNLQLFSSYEPAVK